MRNWSAFFAFVLALIASALLLAPASSSAQALITDDDLLGTWRWTSSHGGIAGWTVEPTETEWVQLKFELAGKLRASLSGIPIEGTYQLSSVGDGPPTIRIELIDVPVDLRLPMTAETFFIDLPEPGVMTLDEGCCDRYIHRLAFDASGFVPIDHPSLSDLKVRWSAGSR
jgi:hypothetical protein